MKDREVRICKETGNRVVMEYVGFDENGKSRDGSDGANGNPGWLCLHNEFEEDDEEAVKTFLLDQEQR